MIGTILAGGNALSKKSPTSHTVYQPDLSKHGQAYQGLAQANPYSNVNYRQSWMQKVLQNLGFRTNYDSYLESMNLQAQEYDNALLQKEYDEKYNDPLAQSQRERAAGLNPDLTGNVGPGESSELRDDGNPPVAPEADDLGKVSEFAGNVIQGVQMAFSLASGITGLSSQILDNRQKRINQIGQEDSLAFNALLNVLPPESDEPLNYNDLYHKFKQAYGGSFKKRYFPNFVQRAYEFQNSLAFTSKEFETKKGLASNRKSYYDTVTNPAYSAENKVMRVTSKVLSDLAYKVNELFLKMEQRRMQTEEGRLNVEDSRLANDLKYEQDVRPVKMANELSYAQNTNPAQLAKNEVINSNLEVGIKGDARDESAYRRLLRSSFKELLQKLDALDDSGNWFAPYAKAAISAIILKNF